MLGLSMKFYVINAWTIKMYVIPFESDIIVIEKRDNMNRNKMIVLENLVDRFNFKFFEEPQQIVFIYKNDYYTAEFLQANDSGRFKVDMSNLLNNQKNIFLKSENLYKDFDTYVNFNPTPGKIYSLDPAIYFDMMVNFVYSLDSETLVKYFDFTINKENIIYKVKSLSNNLELDFLFLPNDLDFIPVSLTKSNIDYSRWDGFL